MPAQIFQRTFLTMNKVLSSVKVLEIGGIGPGPFCAMHLADLGADVISVVRQPGGNPPITGPVLNRGKRGLSLDVRQAEGRQLFLKLIADFDVLVENFRPGTLDRWGLDWATLQRHNPRLSVLRLSGFGQTGPKAGQPGFARIFEAMSGLAHLTGEDGGNPLHINFPLGDSIAGLFAALAIASLAAERARDPDAPGRDVDLSATEALLRVLEPLAAEHEMLGEIRGRSGARATYTAPSNIYATRDGQWITLVGSSDPIFKRLCAAMGEPALCEDPRFATNPKRMQHLDDIDGRIARWFAAHDHASLSQLLEEHSVPFSKIYSIADVVDDPHFQARGAIVRLPDAELGSVPAPAAVPRFGPVSQPPRTGPTTGEHNDEIYGALGLTPADLAALKAAHII